MRGRAYNLVGQKLHLDRHYPASCSKIVRSELNWKGTLIPTSLSRSYVVKLTYKLNTAPRVRVIHPNLASREGEKLPHIYAGVDGDRAGLCLYLPRAREWSNTRLLAETIVPWASEWLLH